jgi:hypothetical protein
MLISDDIPAVALWLALVSSHSAVVNRKTMNPASEKSFRAIAPETVKRANKTFETSI